MKKLWIASVSLMALFAVAVEQSLAVTPMIAEGTRSFTLSGAINDNGNDVGIALNARAGYFFMDHVEAGIQASAGAYGSDWWTEVGGYGNYHFDIGSPLVPYVGIGIALNYTDDRHFDDLILMVNGRGGVRYFFVDHAAIGTALVISAATEKIYPGSKSTDWDIRFFTSWYF